MTSQEPLFPDFEPAPLPPEKDPELSAGRRLTARQHADVERGIHPLTGEPTRPDLGTCGDCALRRPETSYSGKTYPKCDRPGVRKAHSASSDVRAWWPACPKHQKEGE